MNNSRKYKGILIFFILIIGSIYIFNKQINKIIVHSSEEVEEIVYEDELLVHMIDLQANGDSYIVKFGDSEILIDAGGTKDSGDAIYDALNKYCNDHILEYMIITHGDADHLVNFTDTESGAGKWLNEKNNICNTLIDFDILSDKTITTETYKCLNHIYDTEKGDYSRYSTFRNSMLYEKKIVNYFTASQLTINKTDRDNLSISSLKKANDEFIKGSVLRLDSQEVSILEEYYQKGYFELSYDPNNNSNIPGSLKNKMAKFEILYNYFYDHSRDTGEDEYTAEAVDKNLLSVCSMVSYEQKNIERKFLFTGDLEEYDSAKSYTRVFGETKLIEYNQEEFKTPFMFYKAAHHGSATSNSVFLLDVIRPEYVGISASAGGQFDFPSQNAISNITKFTDYVYITSQADGHAYYGSTSFKYNLSEDEMNIKYETEEPQSIFESKWFLENRSFTNYIYNLTSINDNEKSIDKSYDIECTYIKLGHIDILVNCGNGSSKNSVDEEIIEKIKLLCNDRVLDYIIISSNTPEFYNYLVGKNGLLLNKDKYFKKFGTLYCCGQSPSKDEDKSQYLSALDVCEKQCDNIVKISRKDFLKPIYLLNNNISKINSSITFLDYDYAVKKRDGDQYNAIPFVFNISFKNRDMLNYLNLGKINDSKSLNDLIIKNEKLLLNKINYLQLGDNGYFNADDCIDMENYYDAIDKLKSKNNFNILLNSSYGKQNSEGKNKVLNFDKLLSKDRNFLKTVYCTNRYINNSTESLNGTFTVRIYIGKLVGRTAILKPHFELYDYKNVLDKQSKFYYQNGIIINKMGNKEDRETNNEMITLSGQSASFTIEELKTIYEVLFEK